jgi:hypothetical protein
MPPPFYFSLIGSLSAPVLVHLPLLWYIFIYWGALRPPDRPVVREGAPKLTGLQLSQKIKKEIAGHEPQMGIDTKTDRLSDRQL